MTNIIPGTAEAVLQAPLSPREIAEKVDENGMVSGLVIISLSDLIDNDLEGILDLLSEALVGSPVGMETDYQPVAVTDDGELILRVTLNPSLVLDDGEEQE